MNLEDIRGFCVRRGIPFKVMAEYPNGNVRGRLLRELTDGRFQNGAVVRVLATQFWTRGQAPTFAEFARSWTKANAEEHRLLTPEYAYLTDLKHQRAGGDWKALR